MLTGLIVLVLLIFLNAFFAASEIALISANETKLNLAANEGDKKSRLVLKMLEEPGNFLSTIQIGISLAGLFSGAYTAQTFAGSIVTILQRAGAGLSYEALNRIVTAVLTLVLSFFLLVFGELVPKRIAMKKANQLSRLVVYPIRLISWAATPFVKILSVSTHLIMTFLRVRPDSDEDDEVSEEEFRHIMNTDAAVAEIERERIENVFEFDNKTAEDIATRRKDIFALAMDSAPQEIMDAVVSHGYSRIPVYNESIDDIEGILYIKDLLKYMHGSTDKSGEINLPTLLRKPYFVPVSKKTDVLFEEMKKNKVHMSIVVDEYGGTVGLVTMEDLIEEIMGNILDEFDEEETPEIVENPDGTYTVSGRASLDRIAEEFKAELPVDDYDTLSGFIIGQLGNIPSEGDKPEIAYEGLVMKVRSVLNKRIESVSILNANAQTKQRDEHE